MQLVDIDLGLLDPPGEMHRLSMDERALHDLADSIKSIGLINPITVQAHDNGRYEIIAGHRRFCALQINNTLTAPCVIVHDKNEHAEAARLAENIQREDLTPIEEAVQVKRLVVEKKMDCAEIAAHLNRSQSWVEQRYLLYDLPTPLGELVHLRTLPISSALTLARITDEGHRVYLTEYATRSGASNTVLRGWVDEWIAARDQGTEDTAPRPVMGSSIETVVVQVPCFVCGAPTDHRKMRIVRVCEGCDAQLISDAEGARDD